MAFTTPTLFNDEIVEFFTYADIGPLVLSNSQVTQEKLNDSLIFINPESPYYRLIGTGSLVPLFALHAHYSEMRHSEDKTKLSASQDMRKYLRQTMIKAVNKDFDRVLENVMSGNIEVVDEINESRQKMIDCIDDPTLSNDVNYYGYIPFNPNKFSYAHFSRLVMAAKSENEIPLLKQNDLIKLACGRKTELRKVNK